MHGPDQIQADWNRGTLRLTWSAIEVQEIPFRLLRGLCPCAVCVNELTGERTFGVSDAAEDVRPEGMELVGNYAVKISWSDRHQTGLYTWEYLRKIAGTLSKG
ncbi:MAG: DUF971 domain-containing protein [Planctomycetaceae bacterium]|nr:DUF971 domain-containing protein [Planctomycetaceae bacterium]